MSQHELSAEQDPLLSTTPSAIRSANFFLRPFMIAEASMNFFGGTMSTIFLYSISSNPLTATSAPLPLPDPLRHQQSTFHLSSCRKHNALYIFDPANTVAWSTDLGTLRAATHCIAGVSYTV